MQIDGKTVLTGLFGHPVSHSISPLMHNEAFRLLGLNYCYLCFDVDAAGMEKAIDGIRTMGLRGFNCTMPDKQIMAKLADRLAPAARLSGAVNTVVNDDGILTGHNTDGTGYMMAVKDAGYDIIGKEMTLLGGGGAATAIAVQAALDGVKKINIFCRHGRSWNHISSLTQKLNAETNCKVVLYDFSDMTALQSCLEESCILTNATNFGMAPDVNGCPVPDTIKLPSSLIVSDIIYNPRETVLYKRAQEAGCPVMNGLYMLLYQGAEAFRIWTGKDMPIDIIKEKYFS